MTEKLSEDSTPYDTDMEITYDRSKERTRSQENAINMEGLTPWERRLRRRAQAWFEEDTQAQTRFDTYFFKIFVRISSKGIALATCVEGSHWRGLTNRSCISCIYWMRGRASDDRATHCSSDDRATHCSSDSGRTISFCGSSFFFWWLPCRRPCSWVISRNWLGFEPSWVWKPQRRLKVFPFFIYA